MSLLISAVSISYLIPESLLKFFIFLFSCFLKKLFKSCGVKSFEAESSEAKFF